MYTAVLIRKHINNLNGNGPFSIRDFLNYGSRNAVDQVFYRLVKSGQIVRVARGLFIKDGGSYPTILEVATAKAAAFGKQIVTHGSQAASNLGLIVDQIEKNIRAHKSVFACNGPSSSFRFGDARIYFKNISPRKMQLGDEIVGQTVRALWHLGRFMCSSDLISASICLFNRMNRQTLRDFRKIMPSWLSSYFTAMRKL